MLCIPFETRHAATVNVKPRDARRVAETPYSHSLHGCCLLCLDALCRIAMRPEPRASSLEAHYAALVPFLQLAAQLLDFLDQLRYERAPKGVRIRRFFPRPRGRHFSIEARIVEAPLALLYLLLEHLSTPRGRFC